MNKLSGDLAIVEEVYRKISASEMSVWTMHAPPDSIDVEMYVTIGIGLINEHECMFIFPHEIENQFVDIGEF